MSTQKLVVSFVSKTFLRAFLFHNCYFHSQHLGQPRSSRLHLGHQVWLQVSLKRCPSSARKCGGPSPVPPTPTNRRYNGTSHRRKHASGWISFVQVPFPFQPLSRLIVELAFPSKTFLRQNTYLKAFLSPSFWGHWRQGMKIAFFKKKYPESVFCISYVMKIWSKFPYFPPPYFWPLVSKGIFFLSHPRHPGQSFA